MSAYPGSVPYAAQAPASSGHAWVIDKSDSIPLPSPTRAVYVGAAGDVTVQMAGVKGAADGTNPTLFAAVPAGTTLPISVTFIMSTGTVSTNVVPLW